MTGAEARLKGTWSSKTRWGLGLIALSTVSAAFVFLLVAKVFAFGERAQAEVVDIKVGRKGSCAPVLTYTVDGHVHRAAPRVSTSPCPWTKGERTTVYFHRNSPGDPRTAAFWEVGGPFVPSAILLVLGLVMLVRKPRASEILESAPAITASQVSGLGRQLVRIRGTLEARGPLLTAPFTSRQCIAHWARVSRKSMKGQLTEVATTGRCTALAVRDASGAVFLAGGTPLRFKVTADTSGDSTSAEQALAIDRFVEQLGARERVAELGADELVWYEAAFVAGSAVEIAGYTASSAEGATLEPIEHGVVLSRLDGLS